MILSGTSIILRKAANHNGFEVLLLQRNKAIKVHGGSWVFPGGKAENNDIPQSIKASDLSDLEDADKLTTAAVSATREANEEAGATLDTNALRPCSRWVTPESMKKRFDAFFFITRHDECEVIIDDGEIQDFRWLSPTQALDLNKQGELVLPPPTYLTLLKLNEYSDIEHAITGMSEKLNEYRPRLVLTNEGFHSIYQQDSHYNVPSINIDHPTHRLILESGQFTYLSDY